MNKNFYTLIIGFVSGIFIRSFTRVPLWFWLFVLFLSGALLFYEHFISDGQAKRWKKFLSYCFIFIFCFGLGVIRFGISADDNELLSEKILNQKVIGEGVILAEPDVRERSTKLVIGLEEIGNTKVSAKVLATVQPYVSFQYGDRVRFSGTVERPQNFMESDGREFDYVSYLKKEGIQYVSGFPKIELIQKGEGNPLLRVLFTLKDAFTEKIERLFPSPQSALLSGILFGSKRSLPDSIQEEFRRAGVVHIVVLSGYNITIVADAVQKILAFLPRVFGIFFGAIGIVFFALMTGASATTVRASVMALFALLAKWIGRRYDITRALIIAGTLMVIQNPRILVFDLSFELSFLSTLALIYVSPVVEKKFTLLKKWPTLRGIAISTVATQIFVLPFLVYKMGTISLVGLPVNLLILGVIPATMFFGFFSAVVGFLGLVAAFPFAFVANILLWYELKVVKIFSSIPFASIHISKLPLFFVVTIYVFYGFLIYRFYKNKGQPFVSSALGHSE